MLLPGLEIVAVTMVVDDIGAVSAVYYAIHQPCGPLLTLNTEAELDACRRRNGLALTLGTA